MSVEEYERIVKEVNWIINNVKLSPYGKEALETICDYFVVNEKGKEQTDENRGYLYSA